MRLKRGASKSGLKRVIVCVIVLIKKTFIKLLVFIHPKNRKKRKYILSCQIFSSQKFGHDNDVRGKNQWDPTSRTQTIWLYKIKGYLANLSHMISHPMYTIINRTSTLNGGHYAFTVCAREIMRRPSWDYITLVLLQIRATASQIFTDVICY